MPPHRPPRGNRPAGGTPMENGTAVAATFWEDTAMWLYQHSVALNNVFSDNLPLLIALGAFFIGAALTLLFVMKRRAAARGPSPDERKDLLRVNAVARQRTAVYMERYVAQGLNHDGFFHIDAKIPAALQAAANRFAVGGAKDQEDDEHDESNIASMIHRFQRRDDDGSGQSVALIIAIDDGAVENSAGRVLQAHLAAKRLATALESASFATCLMSTLGDAAPTHRSIAAVLKQMQLAKRKFRSSLLYVCGRIRRTKLDEWPLEADMLTNRGRELLKARTLEVGRAADNILELLLEPGNPTPATSWADLAVLVARLAQCTSCEGRPTVILNVIWESEADAIWAREQQAKAGFFDSSADPDGILTAYMLSAPKGLLDAVSILAARRVVTDAVVDRKRSGDTFCNAITDAIRNGVGSAAKSAALGINLGPMTRTLASTAGYHCGVLSPATLAAHLMFRTTSAEAAGAFAAELAAMAPLGVKLSSCLPHALGVQPVGGPRGAQPPPLLAAEALWQDAVSTVTAAVVETDADAPVAAVCIADAVDDPLSARTAVSLFAWQPSTQQQFEDQTLVVEWETVNAQDPPTGSDLEWQGVMQAALDLLLGTTRHSTNYEATEDLFVAAFAEGKACIAVNGWLRDDRAALPPAVTRTMDKLRAAQLKSTSGVTPKVRLVFDVPQSCPFATRQIASATDATLSKLVPKFPLPNSALRCRSLVAALIALGRERSCTLLGQCTSVKAATEYIVANILTERQRAVLSALALAAQATDNRTVPVNALATWIAATVAPSSQPLRAAEVQFEVAALHRVGAVLLNFDSACARVSIGPLFRELVVVGDVSAARTALAGFVATIGKAKHLFLDPIEPTLAADGAAIPAMFGFLPAQATAAQASADAPAATAATLLHAVASTELLTTTAIGAYDGALTDVRRVLQRRRVANELTGDAAEVATEVLRVLRDARVALDSLPHEIVFQLWSRASASLKARLMAALPANAPELIPADYRGDDEHDDLPAALGVVPIAVTVDADRPLLNERLLSAVSTADDGSAITFAAILADPIEGVDRLYVGNAAGHLLLYALDGCFDGFASAPASELGLAKLSAQPVTLRLVAALKETPHKHPVVSIFAHRFKDGTVKLVTASRRDRAIAIWPSFDLLKHDGSDVKPEVVQVLPPPAPEPAKEAKKKLKTKSTKAEEGDAAQAATSGTDSEDTDDEEERSLPRDRRLVYTATVGCSRYDNERLLAERLPDKHESYRRPFDFEESDGRQPAGDTVLLRHFEDTVNTISFLGDRPHSAVATFTWAFADQGAASPSHVTFAAAVELKEKPNTRGYLGIVVGERTGAISLLAAARFYAESDE